MDDSPASTNAQRRGPATGSRRSDAGAPSRELELFPSEQPGLPPPPALAATGATLVATADRVSRHVSAARQALRTAQANAVALAPLAARQLSHISASLPAARRLGRTPFTATLAVVSAMALVDMTMGTSAARPAPVPTIVKLRSLAPLAVSVPATPSGARPAVPAEGAPTPIAERPAPAKRPSTRRPAVSARVETQAIQGVINAYRDAISTLDVAAVRAVWPGADVGRLRREFAAVVDQNLEFERCSVSIASTRARASCFGNVEYGFVPRQRRPHAERRQWQFTLQKAGRQWVIRDVDASRLPAS